MFDVIDYGDISIFYFRFLVVCVFIISYLMLHLEYLCVLFFIISYFVFHILWKNVFLFFMNKIFQHRCYEHHYTRFLYKQIFQNFQTVILIYSSVYHTNRNFNLFIPMGNVSLHNYLIALIFNLAHCTLTSLFIF